jgi:threonine synthase
MGTVVGATLVRADGLSEPIDTLDGALMGSDGGLVELRYAYAPDLLPPESPSSEGMWRYARLLPLEEGPIHYPLAVGGTPLIASPGLRQLAGMPNLFFKDETRSPTGSNKDRATALVLEHAMRRGIRKVTAASTGNVAVSLAVGAAATGLEALIFVPATVGEGKLRLMLLAGATVFKVKEGYEAAFQLSRAGARAFGWCDRNTGVNPLTLEAKKTVAFEIWEQLGRQVPDVVVLPVGDGTTLTALFKGFHELVLCGVADRLPRIVGVQAEGCQPLKRVWQGEEPASGLVQTIADGIAVDVPINGVTAVRDVRESGGGFVAVPDASILESIVTLARHGGIMAEPAAAASYAGLEPARAAGLIDADDCVVALITGTGLKTPQFLKPCGRVCEVRADLAEVEATLVGSGADV